MKIDSAMQKAKTPEEIELESKLSQLLQLEEELSSQELYLATLQVDLEILNRTYIRIVGVKLAELDDIIAKLAEQEAAQKPKDETAKANAERLRDTANKTCEETSSDDQKPEPQQFRPSQSLKELFRQVAKAVHPDLAENDEDREIRSELMVKANEAYAKGNEEKLREILKEWESSPHAVKGEGIAEELVRTIRKISQIKTRLYEVEVKLEELVHSEIFELKTRIDTAESTGRDLLAEMAKQAELQIEIAKSKFDESTIL